MKKLFYGSALAMAVALASPALAGSLTFTLTQDGCTGGCGTPPYGTIVVEQASSSSVTVTETLAAGVRFVSTGAGSALGFNLAGGSIISDLTTGFTVEGADHFSTFGYFSSSIVCGLCGKGGSDPQSGPLSFTVNANGITPESFLPSHVGFDTTTGKPTGALTDYFFASDIIDNKTGNVAALAGTVTPPPTDTPEPAAIALLGMGMLGIVGVRRKTVKTTTA